jgi:hypothetical protein
MKVLRWISCILIFILYTSFPKYYAENLSRHFWVAKTNKTEWWAKLLIFSYNIEATSIWFFYTFFAFIILFIAPNPFRASLILLIIYMTLFSCAYYLAPSFDWIFDKFVIAYNISIIVALIAGYLFNGRKTKVDY